jgi:hypothetical protein
MAQNTENIEARLCDYIEGELDEQGRAEIEKHIEQNPQHRLLLQELMQMRELVHDLPREVAPAEILESLQSQLERSGLLEPADNDDESELVLRVRRLPQFAAIAAMLMLAVGLAGVIYFVLPQSGANRPEFAVAPPIPNVSSTIESDPLHDAVVTVESDLDTLPAETVEVTRTAVEPPMQPVDSTDVFTLAQNMGFPIPDALAGLERAGGIFGDDANVADKVFQPVVQNRLFVVVTTPDTVAANNDVAEFLASNQLEWQAETEVMPEPLKLEQMQRVLASKQRQANVAVLRTESDDARQDVAAVSPNAPAASEVQQGATSQEPAASKVAISGQISTASGPPMAIHNEIWPGTIANREEQAGNVDLKDSRMVVPTAEEFALQVQKSKESNPDVQDEPVIIVRKMTRRQASELSNSLSNRRAGQRAEVMDEAAFSVDPEFRNLTPTGRTDNFGLAGVPATQPAREEKHLMEAHAYTTDVAANPVTTTQPFINVLPSTQPATTQPATGSEPSVDVVIVLQNALPVVEDSSPSTQPVPADALHLEPVLP